MAIPSAAVIFDLGPDKGSIITSTGRVLDIPGLSQCDSHLATIFALPSTELIAILRDDIQKDAVVLAWLATKQAAKAVHARKEVHIAFEDACNELKGDSYQQSTELIQLKQDYPPMHDLNGIFAPNLHDTTPLELYSTALYNVVGCINKWLLKYNDQTMGWNSYYSTDEEFYAMATTILETWPAGTKHCETKINEFLKYYAWLPELGLGEPATAVHALHRDMIETIDSLKGQINGIRRDLASFQQNHAVAYESLRAQFHELAGQVERLTGSLPTHNGPGA